MTIILIVLLILLLGGGFAYRGEYIGGQGLGGIVGLLLVILLVLFLLGSFRTTPM